MIAIPKTFIDEYKPKGECGTLFGEPMAELTRDELLAAIGVLSEQLKWNSENFRRQLEFERVAFRAASKADTACGQCGCTHATAYELGRSDERLLHEPVKELKVEYDEHNSI